MKTKDLVEGILFMNPALEIFFKAAHIIDHKDESRDWKPVEHKEIGFINKFTNPKFIVIVETQIHVFMIGDPYTDEYGNGKGFHVYIIEGFNCKHTAIDKNKLLGEVKNRTKEDRFLPDGYMKRIIYMDTKSVYIFNKIDGKSSLFGKATWSMGTNVYNVDVPAYTTSAETILKQCYDTVEEYYKQ